MDTDTEDITVHITSSKGNRPFNADAAAQYRCPYTGTQTAVVLDGIGSNAEVAELMPHLAYFVVRVAARDGAWNAVLAAAHLTRPAFPLAAAADGSRRDTPDGVMVLAHFPSDQPATIAYVGDPRAYGWSDNALHPLTVDLTIGEEMRRHGACDHLAARHDHQVLTTLGQATPVTVSVVPDVYHQRVLLLSDGAARTLTLDRLTEIAREHEHDPQACADTIVSEASESGSRDDKTAVVVTRPAPIPL
ncbi:PP2C family protein-serine/threonine phosphatase [Kibdelosporangium lantanae]|uniref:PP2C family protein-serine/threonine phosphatase n=1 Tax=Kibdelosporangium lantanae TaxID=1497396 RepID=A0ABW3M509_9PSEU